MTPPTPLMSTGSLVCERVRPISHLAAQRGRCRSATVGVEEDGAALEERFGAAVGDVLLDQGILERGGLLLEDALAASVKGGEEGHAHHLAVLRLLLIVVLDAPEVLAARDAANVIEIRRVLEGL